MTDNVAATGGATVTIVVVIVVVTVVVVVIAVNHKLVESDDIAGSSCSNLYLYLHL